MKTLRYIPTPSTRRLRKERAGTTSRVNPKISEHPIHAMAGVNNMDTDTPADVLSGYTERAGRSMILAKVKER